MANLSLNHLVDETAQTPPVRAEPVAVIPDYLRGHVANGSHPTFDSVASWYLNGQAKVRYPNVSCA